LYESRAAADRGAARAPLFDTATAVVPAQKGGRCLWRNIIAALAFRETSEIFVPAAALSREIARLLGGKLARSKTSQLI
jgi:hypothetical protein